MTYPLTEGIEFKVLSIAILDGVATTNGKPVYQGKVWCRSDGFTYSFDDRYGSWQTSRVDDAGNWRGAHPEVCAALQRERNKLIKKFDEDNPFLKKATNPFIQEGAAA